VTFLDHLEKHQGLSVRSRNLRLTAIHSFFRYAAFELPTYSAQIQRVLAIPSKRFTRKLVRFLTRQEVDALLAAPDRRTWFGRRDHAFMLMAVQTGLRLSEITGAKREDVVLVTGAHVRVIGKGRKERCTPLAKPTVAVLNAWLREAQRGDGRVLFPNAKGGRLSVHGVQYMLNKHSTSAARVCPLLKGKRVTVHLLRHTMAMELLQAGVDRAVIRGDYADLFGGNARHEGAGACQNLTAAWHAGSISSRGSAAELPQQFVASRKLCRVIGPASTCGDPLITLDSPEPGQSPDIVRKGR
jgi:site-specific recombinase XerD